MFLWRLNSSIAAMLQVPDSVLHDEALNQAVSVLPANYNFEVNCSIALWRHTLLCACWPVGYAGWVW